MSNHNHHIVPIYKCIELGLTTSYKIDGKEFYFKENMVEVTRLVHADIHWGYYCKDLSTLLEHCNPPQWVIDMIPLGDKRDMWSAQVNAMGEIDGIDQSGENNPRWIDGRKCNDPVAYHKKYMKEYMKEYNKTPKYKAYQKAYQQTPARKAQNRKNSANWRAREKTETQGVGTLKGFI